MGGIIINIVSGCTPDFTVTLHDPTPTYPGPYSFTGLGIKYLYDIVGDWSGYITITDDCGCNTTITGSTTTDRLDAFIFSVDVDASETVTLPLSIGNTYNFTIDWGEVGSPNSEITSYNDADISYTYTGSGVHDISIFGTCQGFSVNNTAAIKPQIVEVKRWGSLPDFRNLNFWGCTNLTTLPAGPITGASNLTSLLNFMRGCTSYTSINPDAQLFNLVTGVTNFGYAFSESGVTGTIPPDLFEMNINATSFDSTFKYTQYTSEISTGLFTNNTKVTNFSNTFSFTPFSGTVPSNLFQTCTGVTLFSGTFQSTSINTVADTIFRYNTEVTNFDSTFANCLGITSILTNDLFKYNTKVTTFNTCFGFCSYIAQTLPSELFRYNTGVTDFYYTFVNNYSLYGPVPVELFSWCREVTNFGGTFRIGGTAQCALEGDLPADLFINNTKVTTFWSMFRRQLCLTKAPNGLFRNNTLCTNFSEMFSACEDLTLEKYVFSESGNTYNRFSGQTPNFNSMFELDDSSPGTDTRVAPDLWNSSSYSFSGTPSHTNCFYDAHGPDRCYVNYEDIPADWRGA